MAAVLWFSFLALLSVLFWRLIRRDRRKELIDAIPGPPAWPILGNFLTYMKIKSGEDHYNFLIDYGKRYPLLYRIWWLHVPMVKVANPKHIEIILSNTQNIRKGNNYEFLSDWLGTGLLINSGEKWHSRRKLLTPAFHFSILEQFVPVFCENSRILVEKLRVAAAKKPDGVDIVPYITMCALDIICETAMGTSVNAQLDSNSEYVSSLHEVNNLMIHRMLTPLLFPRLVFHLSSYGRRQRKCLKVLHDFTNKVIQERKQERNLTGETESQIGDSCAFGVRKKVAFLDLLIEMQKKSNFTDADIREEVDTFMFEGHDTTAIAMSWILHFIAFHPQVQAKCVHELEEIFGTSDRDPMLCDLNNMKYLERVIKESLRLRPSVYSFSRNTDHDLHLDEYTIPKGTNVSIDVLNLHRNPEIYPDPEKFDPDRFLPENCVGRHPYAYIPFSAGPRNCIGQKFAMMEMKTELSIILRNFELQSESDQRPDPDLLLRPHHGVRLKVIARDQNDVHEYDEMLEHKS